MRDEEKVNNNEIDMSAEIYKVGDKVFITDYFVNINFNNLYISYGHLDHPQEKKITDVLHAKDGTTLYQVKGGHFNNSWIGLFIFNTYKEAQVALNKNLKDIKSQIK